MTPLTCGVASAPPSDTSLLVTEKLGTWGRKSYGLGGVGRSAMVVFSLGLGGWSGHGLRRPRTDPRQAAAVAPGVASRHGRRPAGPATHGRARLVPCGGASAGT